jgi:signal transduction histidine kinase
MIHLSLILSGKAVSHYDTDKPVLSIGRVPSNDIQTPADNVSSQHGQICRTEEGWVYRDLKSTNGSLIVRGAKRYLIDREPREMSLEAGDRICLASGDNVLLVEAIDAGIEFDDELFEQTILAEQDSKQSEELETSLGEDFQALRSTVELARALATLDSVRAIADQTCRLSLKAFPKARRVFFLRPRDKGFTIEVTLSRDEADEPSSSTLCMSPRLIDRCLNERKGYLFLFEQNQMQAIATRVIQAEAIEPNAAHNDRVVLCCPLFHQEQCLGFLEVEAALEGSQRSSLTRRDLALATLMGLLVAARLHDLEQQVERLKLARKATAGFLAATVGHCFKNLLFVPMSIGKMLPLCVRQGQMEEVEWMLARNGVNIRYLDILSNEFAAASKDPAEGFEKCDLAALLGEVAEIINQIGPEKIEATVDVPKDFGEVVCHPAALKRLLMNLALNAVDAIFGLKKGEKGRIALELRNQPGGEYCLLTVRDNGPGIPQDILGNLREIFEQVQASADALSELQQIAERVRSTKEQGFKEHYGLGFLFVCQTVQQHQGDLAIEAKAGEGTTFSINLPRQGPDLLRTKQVQTISD